MKGLRLRLPIPWLVCAAAALLCTAASAQGQSVSVASVAIASSPVVGDTYGPGETIRVEVTFSGPVDVAPGPRPYVTLEVGASSPNEKYAFHEDGSGTNKLGFEWRVTTEARDSNGVTIRQSDAAGTTGLRLGDIYKAGTTQSVNRAYAQQAHLAGHKVNGRQAAVTRVRFVAVTSDPGDKGYYRVGDTIEVRVRFSGTVRVRYTSSDRAPHLTLRVGTATRTMDNQVPDGETAIDGYDRNTMTFAYMVRAIDVDGDGVSIPTNALDTRDSNPTIPAAVQFFAGPVGSGDYYDAISKHDAVASNAAHKVHGRSYVEYVAIAGGPAVGGAYRAGEAVRVEVTFGEPVDVDTDGVLPYVTLEVGISPNERSATYEDGSGTDLLGFEWLVTAGDADSNGLTIRKSDTEGTTGLRRGNIYLAGTTQPVNRAYVRQPNLAGHKVNGTQSALAQVSAVLVNSSPGGKGYYSVGETIKATVLFDRTVRVSCESSRLIATTWSPVSLR